MDTPRVSPRVKTRPLPEALDTLTIAAVLGLGGALIYLQAVLLRQFQLELTIVAAILGIGAATVAADPRRRRWTPLLGVLLCALVVGGNSAKVIYDLTHPAAFHTFAFTVVALELALIGVVAGSAATLRNYRRIPAEPRASRWLTPFLSGMALAGLSAILVTAMPRQATPGVNAEVLAGLPTVATPGFNFAPAEIRAGAGSTVELRLENSDRAPHSFDIDELNVHVPAAPGESALVRFTVPEPGAYTFYCGVPGHRALGMVGQLIVR